MNWAVLSLLAPAAALALIGVLPPLRKSGRPAGYLSIAAVGFSFAASLAALAEVLAAPAPRVAEFLWAPLSTAPAIRFGILLDGLSAPMLAVVALVALVVQVYSLGYMHDETSPSLGRYFAFHSLFAFAMMGLVLSHSTLQTYVFWELVGLGSYLLIGFWFHKPSAARAALKAFWTTRLGDVGFAVGVVLLWSAGGSFVFTDLFEKAASGALGGTLFTLGVLGLYVGAMGKSAQLPFHIWLPDAMEGPTPVSALIHAATMVAAGVYLMVRISPLLLHAPQVAEAVLFVGALTAFLAATMALVERDVKRVLAFSTVSQLGYMMTAVGAGGSTAGFFHLFTHAFFKALLFLAAGSLIHALHTNDLFEMGGVWKRMRLTGIYFLVGGLALAGVFPLSGFFSKDEILADLYAHGHPVAFAVLLLTAFLTAFYMFRAFFLAFFGSREASAHAHESPGVMTGPMGLLAVLAVVAGAAGPRVAALLGHSVSAAEAAGEAAIPAIVPVLGTAAALGGILVAWLGYQKGAFSPAAVRAASGPLATVLERRYYVDDVFEALYRYGYIGLTKIVGWFDRYVIDGVVNAVTEATLAIGVRLRRIQNGRIQDALYAVVIGFLLLVLLAMR